MCRAVVVLVAGCVLAACGHSGSGGSASPNADLVQDFSKVLELRAATLDDLQTISSAVDAVQRADATAATGDATRAADLITSAVSQSALAAPIVARTRTDVFAYQTALAALDQDARNATTPLDDEQRAKVAALCTTGRSEAEAIKATQAALATEWPDYAHLADGLQTWFQRIQRGQYANSDAADAGYRELTAEYKSDLLIGKATADAAEVARRSATDAMDNGIVSVRAAVAALASVPPPSAKPAPESSQKSGSVKPVSAGA